MLVSQFEEIMMLEDDIFNEFYAKLRVIGNSMINLGKKVSDIIATEDHEISP
jgi:hypothetical protein